MNWNTKSVRAFIGAKDFEVSRQFYAALGFEEFVIDGSMSYFKISEAQGFYLQNAYVKDWIDNLMLFVEVLDAEEAYQQLKALDLPAKFEGVRLTAVRKDSWGDECFLHDPSGVLWHFGCFKK